MNITRCTCFCAVLVIALCTVAQAARGGERVLYRSVLPGGRVVYGDAPASAATRTDRIAVEIHPGNAQDSDAAQRALVLTRRQLLLDSAARAERLRQLDNQISAAYTELNRAELQREQGREFQDGDRQGRRISSRYHERQRGLDRSAQQVAQRLDALVRERAALR